MPHRERSRSPRRHRGGGRSRSPYRNVRVRRYAKEVTWPAYYYNDAYVPPPIYDRYFMVDEYGQPIPPWMLRRYLIRRSIY